MERCRPPSEKRGRRFPVPLHTGVDGNNSLVSYWEGSRNVQYSPSLAYVEETDRRLRVHFRRLPVQTAMITAYLGGIKVHPRKTTLFLCLLLLPLLPNVSYLFAALRRRFCTPASRARNHVHSRCIHPDILRHYPRFGWRQRVQHSAHARRHSRHHHPHGLVTP